jgi:hypothetical protein
MVQSLLVSETLENKMAWSDLYGQHELRAVRADVRHPFDSEASGFAFDLGDLTVFVFEDPSDGYRSCAIEPMIIKAPLYSFGCSPEYIRAPVLVREMTAGTYGDGAEGIEMIDTRNGKTILRLGTDNSDDYYPSFTCDWRPQDLADNAELSRT